MESNRYLKPTYWANDMSAEKGHIILLNGVSSSGKGSIAKELQLLLDRPYLNFSVDYFFDTFPDKQSFDFGKAILPMFKGFYKSVYAFAAEGNNIIVDTVFQDGLRDFDFIQSIFKDSWITYVAVKCDLEELKRRERERGNRKIGLAEFQFSRVHHEINYDLEISSANSSPNGCAEMICKFLIENVYIK